MKKICLTLVFVLLLPLCVSAAGEEAGEQAALSGKRQEILFVLKSLGIMIPDENGSMNLDKSLTRAEFCAMLARISGVYDMAENAGNRFSDVAADHWAASYITYASDLGYIQGYPDGTFRPDNQITGIDVETILVNLLGYQMLAESAGGYPGGYDATAARIGLKEDCNVSTTAEILREDAAVMAYNAMHADRMSAVNDTDLEILRGNTLFKERLEQLRLYYKEGIVEAIGGVSLTGDDKVKADRIQIDDYLYEAGEAYQAAAVEDWLGRRVRYFVDEDDVVVSMLAKPNTNEVLEIAADRLDSADMTAIAYYENDADSRTKKAELDESVMVVYNGKTTEREADVFAIHNGKITLLDNDRDGLYDVAFVTTYDSFIIERVSYKSGIVFLKSKMLNNRPYLQLETDDRDFRAVITDMDGGAMELSEIKEGDTITVSQSRDGMRVRVCVVNDGVTGVVSQWDSAEDTITIDGENYKLAKNADGTLGIESSDLVIGTEMSFYTDQYGEIFAINDTETVSSQYVYIVGMDTPRGLSSDVQLKLLYGGTMKEVEDETVDPESKNRFYKEIANEKIETHTLSEKLRVDGQKTEPRELSSALVGTVVKVKINNAGEITEITSTLARGYRGERSYNRSSGTFGGSLGGAFFSDEKTVIFNIPTDTSNEDNFFAKVELRDGDKLEIQGYDFSNETKFASAAVINADIYYDIYPNVDTMPITVINQITKKMNEDGEEVYALNAWRNGKEINKLCRSSAYMENKVKGLAPGDVVRISEDGAGRVADLKLVRKLNPLPEFLHEDPRGPKEEMFGSIQSVELNTLAEYSTTRVDLITLAIEGDSTQFTVPDVYNKAACYLYDTKKKKVEAVSLSEVNSVENTDASLANRAYICAETGTVQVIVVVK